MRAADLLPTAHARIRGSLGMLPVFVGVLFCMRMALGNEASEPGLASLLVATLVILGYLVLTPMPWQWSGDDADKAGPVRGILQALVWNAFWLSLLGLGIQARLGGAPTGDLPVLPALKAHPGWSFLSRGAYFVLLNFPIVLIAGWLFAEREAAERQRQRIEDLNARLEAAARQAQALALQAQLDPHVLYNALGGIAELVRCDAGSAEVALLDLSDLLRRLTRHGRQAEVPLREERELVVRYLALESLRLGNRLKVQWDWSLEADEDPVPPLLLQPLVENAVHHGIARRKQPGTIRIGARKAAGSEELVLQVANEGPDWDARTAREGVGVGNLKRRLLLLQGASLSLGREGAWTVAEIRIGKEACYAV